MSWETDRRLPMIGYLPNVLHPATMELKELKPKIKKKKRIEYFNDTKEGVI